MIKKAKKASKGLRKAKKLEAQKSLRFSRKIDKSSPLLF